MAIRTQADIARDMQAWLQSRVRIVDTGASTVVYALLLQAVSSFLGKVNSDLAANELAQGIGSPASIAAPDLDDIAYNLNMTRKAASPAFGFVTFRRGSAPDVTIRVGQADGSGAVVVGTSGDANGASISFKTTATAFFTPTTPQDPISGFYEVSAPIQAQQPGTVGNQQAGVVTSLITPTQGVSSVVNKTSTTNGRDVESNQDFAVRLVSKILGFQPGILEGLRTIALALPGVLDASVVGPDNAELQRSVIGGVDLVIKGSALTTAFDTYAFSTLPHLLANRPVTGVGQLVSTVGLTQGALTQGAQWYFAQDLASPERLSTTSQDQIGYLGTNLPAPGATATVSYTYDALIKTLQDIVNQDDSHYPSANVMVKRGTQVFVDVAFTITRDGTVSSTVMTNNIATVLSNYFATLGMGATVSQSALVTQIKSVAGIKQLSLPFSTLAARGSDGVGDVVMTLYQYPGVDAQSIDIFFSN